jgi:anti-sigma factor RsiW
MISRLLQRRRFMREHRWTHAHLSDYLDEELGRAERARVEEHVDGCPQCRRVLATLRRALQGLRELGSPRRPGLAADVIARLRDEG